MCERDRGKLELLDQLMQQVMELPAPKEDEEIGTLDAYYRTKQNVFTILVKHMNDILQRPRT